MGTGSRVRGNPDVQAQCPVKPAAGISIPPDYSNLWPELSTAVLMGVVSPEPGIPVRRLVWSPSTRGAANVGGEQDF